MGNLLTKDVNVEEIIKSLTATYDQNFSKWLTVGLENKMLNNDGTINDLTYDVVERDSWYWNGRDAGYIIRLSNLVKTHFQ